MPRLSMYTFKDFKTCQKAEQLFNTPRFVLPAAGNPEMSFQVASLSNQGAENVPPHFVSAEARKIATEVRCDCPVYRSSPNICQHALAAAEDLGVLPKFLQWVRKTMKSSNLSLLIADSVPKTGGEKSTTRWKGAP